MKKSLRIFSTLFTLFLISSISVNAQNVIQLGQGTNRLDDTLFVAQAGDIIELTTNGGVYHEFFSVLIDMPLTIRAAEGLTTKPIIYSDDTRGIFTLRDDFTLSGVKLVGSSGAAMTNRGITTDSIDVKMGYNLTIDDCLFYDFDSGIKVNVETQANNVSITNSIFIDMISEGIYFKNPILDPGSVLSFNLENCTFWNCGDEAIYVEDHDNNTATPGPKFVVKNVNIHNAGSKSIYPKNVGDAIIKNYIVSSDNPDDTNSVDAGRIYGSTSIADYLLHYNTDDVSLKDDAPAPVNILNQDPLFLSPELGNFGLGPLSPAIGYGEGDVTLGDEKWWPSTVSKIEIDGQFGDWAGVEPLEVTENDPAITDSADIKAVWVAIDDDKISFRWDFFDNVNFRSGVTSGDWNMNQGWHRTYFEGNKNNVDMYCRVRSYLGDKSGRLGDSTKFSMLRWDPKSDSLGYDRDEFDGEYFKGAMAWNDEGTSVEMFVLLDSLYYSDADGNVIAEITKDDSLSIWFVNNSKDVFMPPGPSGSKLENSDNVYRVLLSDYYVGVTYDPPVGVDSENTGSQVPEQYVLSQNYPNPFNPTTTIKYSIPETGIVSLKVHNMLGQEVISLVNKEMDAGSYDVNIDASNLSSGIYFYSLNVNDFSSTQKMLLLK